MKIAILGFAAQGQSAYEYWNKPGSEITICDQNPGTSVPKGANVKLGSNYLTGLDGFDLLVRTPALHPDAIKAANPDTPDVLDKVTTVTNEFLRVCPTRNVIGVTGTKGKGTTSTLIAKMLEAAGHRVHLGGNIGTPPLAMLKNNIRATDWIVLELANFQLIDLKQSPRIGVCLMVVPEHLDWHASVDEYITAKQQLFRHQQANDIAIYLATNPESKKVVAGGKAQKIPYFAPPGAEIKHNAVCIGGQVVCATDELKLLGQHNWENACAAVTAVWQVTHNIPAMRQVLTTFSGLEHRLEFVREVNGVQYYDDSFGTAPETAMVAIRALKAPKVVILGGSDKGARYEELAATVAGSNVRAVVIIGATGPKIAEALHNQGYSRITEGGKDMATIVATAQKLAQPGDVVLLSTACASFDMFKNYKDRGEQFKRAVTALA